MLTSQWEKATASGSMSCVWVKADASNGNGGNNCVEVARNGCLHDSKVFVRDSKEGHLEDAKRTVLAFTQDEWRKYILSLKLGYGAIYADDCFVIHKDTKYLTFTLAEWEAFMDGVWKGEFDLPTEDASGSPVY